MRAFSSHPGRHAIWYGAWLGQSSIHSQRRDPPDICSAPDVTQLIDILLDSAGALIGVLLYRWFADPKKQHSEPEGVLIK